MYCCCTLVVPLQFQTHSHDTSSTSAITESCNAGRLILKQLVLSVTVVFLHHLQVRLIDQPCLIIIMPAFSHTCHHKRCANIFHTYYSEDTSMPLAAT
jgi:hypothetical protein